jgi:hypothetical protein
MMVGVDKARQHHLAAGAENRGLRVFCDQLAGGTDLDDDAIPLQYRAVVDLPQVAAIGGFGENGAGADGF